MQSGLRRSLVVLAAAAIAVSGIVLTAGASRATASFAFTRYAGDDRYDTAAKVAVDTFGTADSVIIASGLTYADALAGAYAAGQSGIPVLLTAANSLPAPTSTALTTLKTTKAIIVGGTASVGPGVESALRAKGITPSRIAGANRYATAYEIATDNGPAGVGKVGDDTKPAALLVSGENFPDALSAGPLSFAAHLPILLTTSATLSPTPRRRCRSLRSPA